MTRRLWVIPNCIRAQLYWYSCGIHLVYCICTKPVNEILQCSKPKSGGVSSAHVITASVVLMDYMRLIVKIDLLLREGHL